MKKKLIEEYLNGEERTNEDLFDLLGAMRGESGSVKTAELMTDVVYSQIEELIEFWLDCVAEPDEEFPDPDKFAREMDHDLYIQFGLINSFAKTIKHTWIAEEYKKTAP